MARRSGKNNNFFAPKIFFWCSIILFLSTWNTILCYINFFFVDMKYFFVQHQHVFVKAKLIFVERQTQIFISTQNYFPCNTKFLFWTSFRKLRHSHIFLWSHSNKNIIKCQKINKLSFLSDTKKLMSFFLHHHFYIQFLHCTLSACWSSS